jgi:hypothetical protein
MGLLMDKSTSGSVCLSHTPSFKKLAGSVVLAGATNDDCLWVMYIREDTVRFF